MMENGQFRGQRECMPYNTAKYLARQAASGYTTLAGGPSVIKYCAIVQQRRSIIPTSMTIIIAVDLYGSGTTQPFMAGVSNSMRKVKLKYRLRILYEVEMSGRLYHSDWAMVSVWQAGRSGVTYAQY